MTVDKSTLKTALDHVPEPIQEDLAYTVEWLKENCPFDVAMIWLYGSYARGDYIDEWHVLDDGMISEYRSDVDVLVVIHGEVTDAISDKMPCVLMTLQDQEELSAPLHCIYESAARFNNALSRGEYFYQDVITEGMLLYDDNFELAAPQIITPALRRELSSEYFERFFAKASQFHRMFDCSYLHNFLSEAMHNLHQMTELLFASYLATFTLYKPRTHELHELRSEVKKLDCHIEQIFPSIEEQDTKDFDFLCAAYVDSRYIANYVVQPEVLDRLAAKVQIFQHWVHKECLKAIDEFVPEENYSNGYELYYPLMDFEDFKVKPLIEDLLKESERKLEEVRKKVKRIENEELQRKLNDAGQGDDGK